MDPLGDPLTTCPIQTGWGFTKAPYPSRQFRFIYNPDRQFGNGSVWTRTRTQSDGPELLLTLGAPRLVTGAPWHVVGAHRPVVGAPRCSQAHPHSSQELRVVPKLITNTLVALLYQSSRISGTAKAGRNALLRADTLPKSKHPSLHSTSSQILLEAPRD